MTGDAHLRGGPTPRHVRELVPAWEQIEEWADRLRQTHQRQSRITVTGTHGSRTTVRTLADTCIAGSVPIEGLEAASRRLRVGDLVLVVSATAGQRELLRPSHLLLQVLHDLLQRGITVWGMTGLRPNPVADHCHDVVAVPSGDPITVAKVHHLVAQLLGLALHHSAGPQAIASKAEGETVVSLKGRRRAI